MLSSAFLVLLRPPVFPPLPTSRANLFPSSFWRFIRLAYTILVALPLILLLGPVFLPRAEGWTTLQRLALPFLAGLEWAVTFWYPPGMERVEDEVEAGAHDEKPLGWPGRLFDAAWDKALGLTRRDVRTKATVIPPAREDSCEGVLRDGLGEVKRRPVRATWLWRVKEDGSRLDETSPFQEKAQDGERLLIYFVGGAYLACDPLFGPFIYAALRRSPTNTRALAVAYRTASQPSRAFPAALQDALAAWLHAIDLGFAPENITLVGDSAGGGLVWSLTAYLGAVAQDGGQHLGMPGRVALFSPWLDLSLQSPSLLANAAIDFVHLPQLMTSARYYLFNAFSSSTRPVFLVDKAASPEPSGALRLFQPSTFHLLLSSHPLYSPASASNIHHLTPLLLAPLQQAGVKLLVHRGQHELFADEVSRFAQAAKQAGLEVREETQRGGYHDCALFGPEMTDEWRRRTGIGQSAWEAMNLWEDWMAE